MVHYSSIRIVIAAIVLAAAVTDLRSRRIPNWLTLSGVCAGLFVNGVATGSAGVINSLGGMGLGLVCYLGLYCLRAMGAGDVKLMAAVGAIVGPAGWFSVFIATAMAGGILALALMVWKRRVRETLWNAFFIAKELAQFRAPYDKRGDLNVRDPRSLNMPHGVAIAAGTFACLFLAAI